jgi:DNA helicase-2/ATP-dependent DNA helicase PcrA
MDLLEDLTPAQRAAVSQKDGPLLVVAGAGSGKTRVITRRVAHLVQEGVAPRNILAITFTNKAAGEMRERVERLLGRGALAGAPGRFHEGALISTFHSLCARLLRRFATRLGFEPSFAILDAGDQRSAVREAMLDVHVDPKAFPPPQVAHAIGRAKDRLERPRDVFQRANGRFEEVVAKTYEVYDGLLRQRNALDFDDLLVKTVELLGEDDVRARLQERFQYILIDEYQDTNHAQYELARRLAEAHKNICATGDPDQSIYGWRGADIENILRFERDYPSCKVVLLETNYRSTKTICRAANELIKRNKLRKEKVLVTENPDGAPIVLHEAADDRAEAAFVAKRVEKLLETGTPHDEIAVFYRTNALSRSIEQALFEKGIPYVVVGALAFYERKEVKDILAYLRVLSNPRDDASMIRVLQTPPRGIGKTTLARLKEHGRARGIALSEAAREADSVEGIPSRARSALAVVVSTLESVRDRVQGSVESLVRAVIDETNYLSYLKQEYPEEDEREANVEALVGAAHEFDRQQGSPPLPPIANRRPTEEPRKRPPPPTKKATRPSDGPSLFPEPPPEPEPEPEPEPVLSPVEEPELVLSDRPGVEGFLEQVALIAEQDALDREETQGKVSLMTVHTAKGLEFEAVFLVGLEEGLFPNARALEAPQGLEEERRLAYVAITRAKKRLFLTHAGWRSRFGRSDARLASPFLYELPGDVFESGQAPREIAKRNTTWDPAELDDEDEDQASEAAVDEDVPDETPTREPPGDEPAEGSGHLWSRPIGAPRSRLGTPSGAEARKLLEGLGRRVREQGGGEATASFAPGDAVRHEHFGLGRVVSVNGSGPATRVCVRFHGFGEKNLVLQYARLVKVTS